MIQSINKQLINAHIKYEQLVEQFEETTGWDFDKVSYIAMFVFAIFFASTQK